MRSVYLYLCFFLLCILGNTAVFAAEKLKTFQGWSIFKHTDSDGETVLSLMASPTKSEGKYTQRGKPYCILTRSLNGKTPEFFMLVAGYSYLEKSHPSLHFTHTSFQLIPKLDKAFTPDEKEEKRIIEAMKRGKQMIVQGISARHTKTKDTYSLMGFSKAYTYWRQAR